MAAFPPHTDRTSRERGVRRPETCGRVGRRCARGTGGGARTPPELRNPGPAERQRLSQRERASWRGARGAGGETAHRTRVGPSSPQPQQDAAPTARSSPPAPPPPSSCTYSLRARPRSQLYTSPAPASSSAATAPAPPAPAPASSPPEKMASRDAAAWARRDRLRSASASLSSSICLTTAVSSSGVRFCAGGGMSRQSRYQYRGDRGKWKKLGDAPARSRTRP